MVLCPGMLFGYGTVFGLGLRSVWFLANYCRIVYIFIYEITSQYLELLCQIVGIAPVCNSAAFVPCNSEVQRLLCFFLPATPVFYFSEVAYS